jgi:hypothetical protein
MNPTLGVLDRSESLAASLGARLTGPRFLRGIERFFDGPIKINSPHPLAHSITWLDVVTFAKAHPDAFSPVTLPDGAGCRQFMYNGFQAEIAEDDWRLIYSGALDKFPLEHIFEEDEAAELATLEIMLQRSSLLFKKADEVAARARLLNRRLETRSKDVARQLLRHADASAANVVRDPAAAARHPTISTRIFFTSLWWLRCKTSRRKVHLQDITITSSSSNSTLALALPCLLLLLVLVPWQRQFLRRHRISRYQSLLTPVQPSQQEQRPLPLHHPHHWPRFWPQSLRWPRLQQRQPQWCQLRHKSR